jgi:hypothetical protein
LAKYRAHEVASNKLEKGPFRDYETASCSPLALKSFGEDFLKNLLFLQLFGLSMILK